jgi:subfamily B ATP-binding cassette protein MsbA
MNTYWRILRYGTDWKKYVAGYVGFSLLSILFGLTNLTLLKPFFDIIFQQLEPAELVAYQEKMSFAPTFQYVKHTFYYYLTSIVKEYGEFGSLIFVCIVIVISFLLSNITKYLSTLILAIARTEVIKNLRIDIFRSVTRMHIGYFTDQKKGDLMSRVTTDITQVDHSLGSTLKVFFREPATVVVYFILLFSTSYALTLFTLIILPVLGFVISEIAKRLKKTAIEGQESLSSQLSILDEAIGGMRVVKAFNAVKYINRIFDREVKRFAHIDLTFSRRYEFSSPVSEFLGALGVVGILIYGGHLVFSKQTLEASSFMMFIAVFTQILQPAKAISSSISYFQRAIASGDRVFALIDSKPLIVDRPNAVSLKSFSDRIEFDNVSFSYQSEPVLRDVSFTIEKGKMVALVGPSGGGKSTLANLLPRFYDPQQGEVRIDGKPLPDYKMSSIRGHMGIVTQESILFNDTIFNNIAFGQETATEQEVIRAAKIANAHDFIMQHPDGYHRIVGERGGKLSGGQKQRITIARALLKNPPILILDEATSALDSESEALVQDAINHLMQNRTSLVIAHRLSTVQNADEIIVVHEGRVIERGTHEALIRKNGFYQKLTSMQGL